MPSDSKHDKNQKITNFTTKISAPFTKHIDQAPNTRKRPLRNLSPSSPVKGTKKHIMENTSNNISSSVENPPSHVSSASAPEPEISSGLEKALGPLINQVHLLRKSVDTVHADYADLKKTISKQKEEVKQELAPKIESNTQQLKPSQQKTNN